MTPIDEAGMVPANEAAMLNTLAEQTLKLARVVDTLQDRLTRLEALVIAQIEEVPAELRLDLLDKVLDPSEVPS